MSPSSPCLQGTGQDILRRPSTGCSDRQLRVWTPRGPQCEDECEEGRRFGRGEGRRDAGCHEQGWLHRGTGVNLPKGEGKLYSRFYRDPPVMDVLGSIVLFNVARTHLLNATSTSVRVWCCGCSSGEEVWSVRFLWKELLEQYVSPHLSLEIIGTDNSEAQIATCKSATYSSAGMGTLPKGWKERCFVAAGQEDSGDVEYLVGRTAPGEEAATTSMQGVKLVDPEVGMPVLCSRRAPAKVQAAFKQNGAGALGTICEVAHGQCKVAFAETGQVMWCSTSDGRAGFHLAPSLLSVCPHLRQGVTFELQDVREGVASSGSGGFDVVLCRYSAFLYLSTEEAQAALKAMVDCMAPGAYLVIGQREMLPVSQNLSLPLNQITECGCIYQKDTNMLHSASPSPAKMQGAKRQVAAAAAGAPRATLPAMVQYETLDDFYVEGLHLKGVRTALGRQPWFELQRSHLSESSARILEASDRPKGPVLERIECAEEVRLDSAKKLCALGGMGRCEVKKAVYKPALMESMARKKEQEQKFLAAANKVVPAGQLRQFVDRMASDMARRQDKMKDFYRDVGQEGLLTATKSKRLKLSRVPVPRVAMLVSRSAAPPPPRLAARPSTSSPTRAPPALAPAR